MIGKKWLISFYSLLFFCIFTASLGWCGIYVYKDKNGVLHFTDTPRHHGYRSFFKTPKSFYWRYKISDKLINKIAQKYELAPALLKAIIKVESDFDHAAISKTGAMGLMQLMPETAREMGVKNPFSPEENIEGGARYLRQLLNQFQGNLSHALAAYFVGPNAFSQTGYTPEIKNYVNRVLLYYQYYLQ